MSSEWMYSGGLSLFFSGVLVYLGSCLHYRVGLLVASFGVSEGSRQEGRSWKRVCPFSTGFCAWSSVARPCRALSWPSSCGITVGNHLSL